MSSKKVNDLTTVPKDDPYSDNQEIIAQLEKLANTLDDMKTYNTEIFYECNLQTSDIYFVKETVVHLWGLYDTYLKLTEELWDIRNG